MDDSFETATNRLSLYKEQTEPLVGFYKKEELLLTINSERDKNVVFAELLEMIN
jgi:adenylate kinase